MKTLFSACVATLALTTVAQASVVDLNDGFGNGEILFDQIDGLTVTAESNGGGTANDFAIIIDTNNSGSGANGDADLAAGFDDPSTMAIEDLMPGNVLAIAEGDCGAGSCRVDDNATGGMIQFAFEEDKVFNSLNVFDLATNQLTITLLDADLNTVFALSGPGINTDTGDNEFPNEFTGINIGGVAFRTAIFEFGGSGAIGDFDIAEVPLPAALPFLLTGLAGLGFAGRRRKSA
ncbi:MAG: VPLPA-CTERM sorting domain-containing protein [Pseudomonadota bacterium]